MDVEAPVALVLTIGVHISIDRLEDLSISNYLDHVVGYRIASFVCGVNHKLLPALHLLIGVLKQTAEEARIRIDQHLSYTFGAVVLCAFQPGIMTFATLLTHF